MLISTVSQTQQQAMMNTFFFFSRDPPFRIHVPIANMPPVVQWLTVLNPMRYFLVIVRGVFLRGGREVPLAPTGRPGCHGRANPRRSWAAGVPKTA